MPTPQASSHTGHLQILLSKWREKLAELDVAVSDHASPTRINSCPPERHEVAKARRWRAEEEYIVIAAMYVVLLYILALLLSYKGANFDLEVGQNLLAVLSGSTGGIVASLAAILSVIAVVEVSRSVRATSDVLQRREQLIELFRTWESVEYVRARDRAWRSLARYRGKDAPHAQAIKQLQDTDPESYQSLFTVMAFFGLCRILIGEDMLNRRSFNVRFGLMYTYWYYWAFQTISEEDVRNLDLLHGLFLDVVEEEWICSSTASSSPGAKSPSVQRWRHLAPIGSGPRPWRAFANWTCGLAGAVGLIFSGSATGGELCVFLAVVAVACIGMNVLATRRVSSNFPAVLPDEVREWLMIVKANGPKASVGTTASTALSGSAVDPAPSSPKKSSSLRRARWRRRSR